MNTDVRELFEKELDVEPSYDLAERALRGARSRRRNRLVVSGAVVVTAAMVLGFVIGTGQLRSDSEPRPADVAAIPSVLPPADEAPVLRPGAMSRAVAAYVWRGRVVFVSADPANPGALMKLPESGQAPWGDFFSLSAATGVTLSPDGRYAVVQYRHSDPPVLIDIGAAGSDYPSSLSTVSQVGADSVLAPSVVGWENDSQHFICACSVDGGIPQLVRVDLEGTWEPVASGLSPLRVAAGTAGIAAQIEANGGRWLMSPTFSRSGPAVPESYAMALSRGEAETYIALSGRGFTVGTVSDGSSPPPFSDVLMTPSHVDDFATAIGVEAARGGYVVKSAAGSYVDTGRGDEPYLDEIVLVYVSDEGQQQILSSLPPLTEDVSISSDLVGAPEWPRGTLPTALPSPDGLHGLADAAVEVASAAYVADGALVIVDAESGASYVVDSLTAAQDWSSGTAAPAFPTEPYLSLSPDGRFLAVANGVDSDGTSRLLFLDIARAQFESLPVELDVKRDTPIPSARMAWSPDGEVFYCVCGPPGETPQLQMLSTSEVLEGGNTTVTRGGVQPNQLTSSAQGLLGRFGGPEAEWRWVPDLGPTSGQPDCEPLGRMRGGADMVVLGPEPAGYLEWAVGGLFCLHIGNETLTASTAHRWLAGAWGANGPIVVTYSKGDIDWQPLPVSWLAFPGNEWAGAGEHTISWLPAGTTAAAFSALAVPDYDPPTD